MAFDITKSTQSELDRALSGKFYDKKFGYANSELQKQAYSERFKRQLESGVGESQLATLLGSNPDELTEEKIATSLKHYENTLLSGVEIGKESSVDARTQSLLDSGREIANKITARLKSSESKKSTPGVQAQTTTSLLG